MVMAGIDGVSCSSILVFFMSRRCGRYKNSIIRTLTKPTRTRNKCHLLSREQQSILVRLRSAHNRLNCHMARKLKLVPSPTCPCGEADQTAEHVLQTCPLFNAVRAVIWPDGETLKTKLHGCHKDLEKTTLFMARTGLTV